MISILSSKPGSVAKAIDDCLGFSALKAGDRVLIKPNLCLGGRLIRELPGMSTSVGVVEQIVQHLHDHGIADITIGEGTVLLPSIRSSTDTAFREAGYNDLRRRYGVELVDFNQGPFKRLQFEKRRFNVAKSALEFDFLINAPALKTHVLTKVSLAMKNLKGVLKMSCKKGFHKRELGRLIAGLNTLLPSDLVVVDGQLAMEFGPDSDVVKPANLVIAGTDVFETDVVCSQLLGIAPQEVEHIAVYAELTGRNFAANIEVKGLAVDEAKVPCRWSIENEADLYAMHGVGGFEIAQDNPQTACSGCRCALHIALERLVKTRGQRDFDGMEIVMGQNTSSQRDITLRLGDCATKKHKNSETVVCLDGCPPDIHDIVDLLDEM